jgi:hypothetical protein
LIARAINVFAAALIFAFALGLVLFFSFESSFSKTIPDVCAIRRVAKCRTIGIDLEKWIELKNPFGLAHSFFDATRAGIGSSECNTEICVIGLSTHTLF